MRATAQEETEGEIIAEGFVIDATEIGIKLGSDNVARCEGMAPLGTEVGGKHM
jgi:hypothetical protein